MDVEEIIKKIKKTGLKDYISILKLGKILKKNAVSSFESQIKIAIIGTCSMQHFVIVLKLLLLKYDINADILEGRYDGINEAVFDRQSDLYSFQPNIVIILSDYRDIHDMPVLLSQKQDVDKFLDTQGSYYQLLWEKISEIKGCYIFQSNIVLPLERELGNMEANVYYSKRNIYQLLNIELLKKKLTNVTIIDMEYISASIGKEKWFDYTLYFSSKINFSLKYIGIVCDIFAQQISTLLGKGKKCLILDLDNTLWGGVVADEGTDGIKIDPNDPVGEAYRFFQQYVLQLKNRGVILAVISKNDYRLAKEPFDVNDKMILKYNDFSAFIANWDSKASNIDLVAEELNIGTDSFVFFDDNPAEREIVKMYHPEVQVIEVPENVADYVIALESAHPFEWINLTQEDIKRSISYSANRERKKFNLKYKDYKEYLSALSMKGKLSILEEQNVDRFVQLINKSNQFNLRTQRYTEANIKEMLYSDEYKLISVSLEDRFSNFGVISCIILKKFEKNCFIDTWVMSCRVLKREVERLAFKKILEIAIQWNCDTIVGEYLPTKKNSIVKDLYPNLGFSILEKNEKKYTYTYDVRNNFITCTSIEEM